jgi:hypothetical protein
MPLTLVCSGPINTRDRAIALLEEEGFAVDGRHGDHHWGHPSYKNPVEAAAAGKPQSGHTPGTPHPTTGRPYVADRRVSFVTVRVEAPDIDELYSTMLGAASDTLERIGWHNRSHWTKELIVLTEDEVVALRGLIARLGRG